MATEKPLPLIGIRAAGRELGVAASTITRYVRDHPSLNRAPDGAPPKVNLDELRDHRARNVNHAKSGNHAGLLQDEAGTGEAADGERRSSAGSEGDGEGDGKGELTLSRARTVREAAQAQSAQLDLQERLDRIVAMDSVVAAVYEAGQMLLKGLEGRNRQLAEEFASMNDSQAIAARLDKSDMELLERIADALDAALNPDTAAAA